MAETTQVTVTKSWTKLADSDCTIQAVHKGFYCIAVNALEPTDDAHLTIKLDEPATFAYATAIWCRLPQGSIESVKVNVIK